MKTMKEIVIGQMDYGEEVLKEIELSKKIGRDFSLDINSTRAKIDQYHPDYIDLVVVETFKPTEDSRTLRLAGLDGYLPPFQAGQYINVFVTIDGVRTSRPYSISSSPKQRGYYEITVARVEKGFVSDYLIDEVKVGDQLEVNGPAGQFHFNPVFHDKRSVFLAGGSGITPYMSMIRQILETGADREIHLLYGCRNEDVSIYHKELGEMADKHDNLNYHLVVSDENTGFTGREGFLDAKCISELVGDLDNTTYYICGPQIMMDFCTAALDELEIPKRKVRQEMFGATPAIQKEPGWPQDLSGEEVFKVKIEGKVIEAKSSEPLLNSIEAAGIRINVCCRSGECSYCRVKLVSGQVFMPRGVILRYADEKYGYIHSCKAYPISDLELSY